LSVAQVTVQVNGKPFVVGCEDGQETRLTELASQFDAQVRQVADAVGQIGETRLFLMAGLMMADELAELRSQLTQARRDAQGVQGGRSQIEVRAAEALDSAARRIEALVGRVGSDAG
jgi:cell division protein ZapA